MNSLRIFALLFFLISGAAAQTGSISGTVRFSPAGATDGLSATVVLATPSGDIVNSVDTTGAGGSYSFPGVFVGNGYRLYTLFAVRTSNSQTYIDELYNNIPCLFGTCNLAAGNGVNVLNNTTTTVNFVLSPAASIVGTVTGPSGGTVVALHLYNSAGTELTFFSGQPGGTYTIGNLTTGTYYVATGNEKGLIDELHSNIPCPGQACNITGGNGIGVTAPNATTVNFTLTAGGKISGLVQNSAGTKTLDSAQIEIYSGSGSLIETRSSSFDGTYDTGTGLPGGSYFVKAARQPYVPELFSNIDCVNACTPSSGTAVNVTAPNEQAGINFSLSPGYELSGRIRKRNLPRRQMARVFIKNSGLLTTGAFIARGYLSQTNPKAFDAVQIFENAYAGIAAGVEEFIKVRKRRLGQNKFLVVELDVNQEVPEGDETDNIFGKKLGLRPAAN